MAKNNKVTKKRVVKIEATGMAFVKASFNNVIVSLTNNEGQVISWASAGKMGFKGSKKNTPYVCVSGCMFIFMLVSLGKRPLWWSNTTMGSLRFYFFMLR